MIDTKWMIGELEEDYDLLTYDCEPSPEECKIANDIRMIIDMLRERESKKPRSATRHGANPQVQHFCGKCNAILFHKNQKYCIECGTPPEWTNFD